METTASSSRPGWSAIAAQQLPAPDLADRAQESRAARGAFPRFAPYRKHPHRDRWGEPAGADGSDGPQQHASGADLSALDRRAATGDRRRARRPGGRGAETQATPGTRDVGRKPIGD